MSPCYVFSSVEELTEMLFGMVISHHSRKDFGRDGDLSPRAERKLAFIGGFGSLETQAQFVRRMNLSCDGRNSSLIPFSYEAENPKKFVLVISGRLDGIARKSRPSEAL
ncbi:unnamed protein product [Caenorhabditis auriculariae]|uniref:Uncharacterized protein n=1 Tax=Caenorhabditis auriculariae TaxID=2777116 RepID=A0A8S1HVT8_9PELO|nr:unnamed protein product [Caenorhabditis auriculariae]